jgi:hypothetical protein
MSTSSNKQFLTSCGRLRGISSGRNTPPLRPERKRELNMRCVMQGDTDTNPRGVQVGRNGTKMSERRSGGPVAEPGRVIVVRAVDSARSPHGWRGMEAPGARVCGEGLGWVATTLAVTTKPSSTPHPCRLPRERRLASSREDDY